MSGKLVYIDELVRCRECKNWARNTGMVDSPNGYCSYLDEVMNGYDFCSYGERRKENERKTCVC